MKHVFGFILALALWFGAAAQSPSNTVTVAVGVDATAFDPWLSTNTTDKHVVSHVFDTVLKRNADMEVVPNLATSYEAVSDTVWQFTLRDDVFFTDGEPLTARDVAYTVAHLRTEELRAPSIAQFDLISEVEVLDDYTFNIVTKQPFPALPAVLSEFWIVPEHHTKAIGALELGRNPVGSGPYQLVEWVRDSHMLLQANPDWWGGAPAVEFVEFRVVPEQNARIAQIQTGEADIVAQIPVESLAMIERSGRASVKEATGPRSYFVGFDTTREGPLQNPLVRQALNYAVNVEEILAIVFDGRGVELATIVTPEQFGFNDALDPYGYDPEKARELLAEAGYQNGLTLSMEAPIARYPKDSEIAQVIAGQLQAAGVTVNLEIIEWGTYVGQFGRGEAPDLYYLGWSIPTFDPDALLTPLLLSGYPYSRYSEAGLGEQIAEARSIVDPEVRAALYHEIQESIFEQAPMIFLFQLNEIYGVSDRIDWEPRADERIYLWETNFR